MERLWLIFTSCERSLDLRHGQSPNAIRVTGKRDRQCCSAPVRKLMLMRFFAWVYQEIWGEFWGHLKFSVAK